MPSKKSKKNNPSTIEELISPVKEETSTETTETKPDALVLQSGASEESLVNLMMSTNELCQSVMALVSAAAMAAGLPPNKETLLYCAAALVRAADSFFIMSKFSVDDELKLVNDLVKISDKLAKLPGQGVPSAKAPSIQDWAKKAPSANSSEEEAYLTKVKKNKDLN